MNLYVAEQELDENKKYTIRVVEEISQEELDSLNKGFAFCGIRHSITEIKNIAAYEMDFTADKIVERFQRGDVNRTTEGHGLGLAIAKSFSEACGGHLDIIIDGDMFKAVISYPLYWEN